MTPVNKAKGNKNQKPGMVFKNRPASAPRTAPQPQKPTSQILNFPPPVPGPAFVQARPIQKWVLARTPILQSNSDEQVYMLNPGNTVTVSRQYVRVPGSDASWAEVEYKYFEPPPKGEKTWIEQRASGWVDELYLEDFNDPYPEEIVKIENPTPDPRDARQYMTWPPEGSPDSATRNNMCGELCVAYVVGKEIDPNSTLESVLRNWEKAGKTGPFSYNLGTIKEGTLDAHLKNILKLPEYNYSDTDLQSFIEVLARGGRIDWASLKDEIKTHYFIAQVVIETLYGTLISRDKLGIRHWVVVEDITHNGKRVKLYNPFPNKLQEYSFDEFLSSCHINLGLFVRRKTPLSPDLPTMARLEVALDAPPPPDTRAVQYIFREGGKKTNLCGEFSVAYVLGKSADHALLHWRNKPPSQLSELSTILKAYGCFRVHESDPRSFTIGSVLDYWRDVQPDLYRHHVIDNQTTSPRELVSILEAYGYNNDDDITSFEGGLTDPAHPVADPNARRLLLSPGRIADKLKTHFFIAGVGIEGVFGRLKARGPVRHWVVVEQMELVGRHFQTNHYGGNGGWVQLYNPFTDVMEEYSYLEFVNSMNESGSFRGDSGFWVKRNVQPLFEEQDRLPAIPDQAGIKRARQPKRDKPGQRWKREKLIDAIQKRIRQIMGSGTDAKTNVSPGTVDRIANQLSGSGWSRDEIIREIIKLLPAQGNEASPNTEFETKLREKLGDAKAPAPPLPADVLQLVREQSGGDVDAAKQLVNALYDAGFLLIGANGACLKRSFPEAPDLRQTAIRGYMNDLSNALPEVNATDDGLAVKISNLIRPMLASRAMDEIRTIESLP